MQPKGALQKLCSAPLFYMQKYMQKRRAIENAEKIYWCQSK